MGYYAGKNADPNPPSTMDNPFHGLGYDDLALTNPSGIGFLDSVENSVGSVPVIGSVIAPIITPAALGAAAAAVHILLVPRLQGYLPEWAQPYSYSIGGAAVGIVSGVVASRASDTTTRTVAGLIGGSAVAIGIGIDFPHSSSSNLSDAYAQPRPRPDRHDTYTKCSASTTCDAMLDVSWLSKRTLKLSVTEKETRLAKGFPHTTDPIASKSRTSARTPYAQRRSAGGSCASLSQHMADSAAISTAQLHIRDIA